ncbi:hypothetical protein Ae168Ps1_1525 [Pseudonocardia sp. Ae168_Ps1]|nr:hypothetical protein Ae150APs1_1520 [Pseudonocardia sp. Ae150A_Ps1]OLL79119.1 hypothetical protein Ae168Ps1_1525 [Pseudonocardia sp. Ae168_Ps1]OLL86744.1 hypothetical protein Ae263Ps1_3799c [Pseudonocardia sp. Ae263_Ps1]OLL93211.1 hypothetical protein Ae356Ps1_3108 [Pseudonocardia sp. Ae356_Ps1]
MIHRPGRAWNGAQRQHLSGHARTVRGGTTG